MVQGLLRNRDYRLLWGLLVASSIALWLRILGTAQALLESEGDPWRVGLIGAIQLVVQIPALLWGLLTLYQLALGVAVTRSKPGVPTPLGWKLLGIAITFGHGALFASLARSILTGEG